MKKIILFLSILFVCISISPICCGVSAASIRYLVQSGSPSSPTWRALEYGEILVDLASTGQSFNAWYNSTVVATDEVWMINGTYNLTGVITVSAPKISNHSVYGSFTGTESSVNERVKVPGGKAYDFLNPTVLYGNNASTIISQGSASVTNVVFDGLTIKNGNATNGGGAFIREGFTLQNSIVSNNTAITAGGVYLYTGGKVSNCLIENNKANQGGGVSVSSSIVGVMPSILDCMIQYNQAYTDGGGIRVQHVAPGMAPEIKNTVIRGNSARDAANTVLKFGSGVQVTMGNPVFSNCIIANNTGLANVNLYGGEFLNTTIVNSNGFAVYINTLANSSKKLTNCIIWGNLKDVPPSYPVDGSITNTTVEITNCAVNPDLRIGTSYVLTDNFLLEALNDSQIDNKGPGFINPTTFIGAPTNPLQMEELESSNWDIKSTSGAIDKGLSLAYVTTDILDRHRPAGTAYDVGAYEYNGIYSALHNSNNNQNILIYSENGRIVLKKNNQIGDRSIVNVYNVAGQKLFEQKLSSETTIINSIFKSGVYIVKVGNDTKKVVVK